MLPRARSIAVVVSGLSSGLSGLACVGAFAACGPKATPPRVTAPVGVDDGARADGGATSAAAKITGEARAARLLYPALACVPRRAPSKGPKPPPDASVSCDEAGRRRAAWLAEIDATGRLPRDVPEGAVEGMLGKTIDQEQVRLQASGPIGELLVDVDPDGTVRRVISGAIDPLVFDYGPRHMAVRVLSPDITGAHDWELTDLVTREMRVVARVGGHARVSFGGVFVGTRGASPQSEEQASWAKRELPPAARTVTLLDDPVAYYDVDAGLTRSFAPTDSEARVLLDWANVVVPKPGAVAVTFWDRSSCLGRWFDAKSKEGRPICDARAKVSGARLLRASSSAKGASEIVDVDGDGGETVVARVSAPPSSIHLVGTADDQVAYMHKGRLHVEEIAASGGRPNPRVLDAHMAIACSRIGDGSCAFADARLLSTGAAIVQVSAGFEDRLYFVTPAGWATTPMSSAQHKDVSCIGRSVSRGTDTTILVQCPGDEPEWHLRTVAQDGTITDALPSTRAVEIAEIAGEPPSTLKLAGEPVCAAGGLVYQGPACKDLARSPKRK